MEELNMMVDLINRKRHNSKPIKKVKSKICTSISATVYAFIGGVILAELIILLILKVEGIC